ncbi:MAG: hypothetical protein FWD61_13915 [Phycisphaerales bacterium]|nr:hypothetical protein [Phycisphaerales bacterium]
MRATQIELTGKAGHVAIKRKIEDATIRINSFVHNPKPGQKARRTWKLPATITDDDLLKVAAKVQRRCDGCVGTYLMVLEYFVEMQKFQK